MRKSAHLSRIVLEQRFPKNLVPAVLPQFDTGGFSRERLPLLSVGRLLRRHCHQPAWCDPLAESVVPEPDDDEMRRLTIDVFDRTYRSIHTVTKSCR
jgi:hypothetical protein